MITLYPQYEYYTAVEITLTISGDREKTFSISQTGKYLQSVTIKEGTVGGGVQFTPNLNGDMVASGTVTLIDDDNAIFRSLFSSKAEGGSQLENYLKIIIHTYSGSRTYDNCRIKQWSVSFNGGVPTISLTWETIGSSGVAQPDTPNTESFDPDTYEDLFIKTGVKSFSEFKEYLNKVFKKSYSFEFKDGFSENDLILSGSEVRNSKENQGEKVLRFTSQYNPKQVSLFDAVMTEFCRNCQVKGQENKNLCWNYKDRKNNIIMMSAETYSNRVIPYDEQKYGKDLNVLEETVFVYNTSVSQGSVYSTPWGDKTAFVIETIETNFTNENAIVSNLSERANTDNPNGNMIMTSKGRVMLPASLPQAITQSIHNIASVSLTEAFEVRITVYNYIHFYVLGNTCAYLVVFDHLGQIHPVSGKMRVYGYEYTIGDGVIKATVTLKPAFDMGSESFYDATSFYLHDFTVSGSGQAVDIDGDTIIVVDNSINNISVGSTTNISTASVSTGGGTTSTNIVNQSTGTGLNVNIPLDKGI